MQLSAEDGHRLLAREMFQRALPGAANLGPRGTATAMLGLAAYLTAEPDSGEARQLMTRLAEKLVEAYQQEATDDWRWFEPTLTYDNALHPHGPVQGLRGAGRSRQPAGRPGIAGVPGGGLLSRTGNWCWWAMTGGIGRGSAKAEADEQADRRRRLVLAFRGAYFATGDSHYLQTHGPGLRLVPGGEPPERPGLRFLYRGLS